MSWNTDKEPIDYLRQRIKYYKKKRSMVMGLAKNPAMIAKYGDLLPTIIGRRLLTIESMIVQFERAAKDLETIREIEEKANNGQKFKS